MDFQTSPCTSQQKEKKKNVDFLIQKWKNTDLSEISRSFI